MYKTSGDMPFARHNYQKVKGPSDTFKYNKGKETMCD